MKPIHTRAAVAALLVCGAVGCGGAARRPRNDVVATRVIGDALPLRVQNNTPGDMNVFVVVDGAWKCIGTVTGLRSATFELGALERNGAPLRIRATPVRGQGAAHSDPLTVFPGQTVTFTIEPDLARSSATVR